VISLSVDLLKDFEPSRSAEESEIIDGISREVKQMASLIESTLSVSRIELGTLIIEPKPIDIMAFAKERLEVLMLVARKKNLTLRGTYTPESLIVPMDPMLLQIIFQNLLSNAIKYTPSGGTITLALERQSSRILIRVIDSGQGIPHEHQQYIFSKLYRAPNARKSAEQGSGFGLYIVKSIINEVGGKIWFESEEGQGTTFFVSFPLSGMKAVEGDVRA
jgi:signal transduction histidine kinase